MSSKLTTRAWIESDMPTLAEFHRQMNPGYRLPETFGPLFAVRRVVVDESGRIVAFGAVKVVSEGFLWVDSQNPPLKRAKSVKILHQEMSRMAKDVGLEEVSCWLPEKVACTFAKVIEKLGWRKSPWASWS